MSNCFSYITLEAVLMEASNLKVNGNVVALNNKNKIIGRFSSEINLGSKIFDNRNRLIGEVEWIFGPVDDPFYEINTYGKKMRLSISDTKLFAEED